MLSKIKIIILIAFITVALLYVIIPIVSYLELRRADASAAGNMRESILFTMKPEGAKGLNAFKATKYYSLFMNTKNGDSVRIYFGQFTLIDSLQSNH